VTSQPGIPRLWTTRAQPQLAPKSAAPSWRSRWLSGQRSAGRLVGLSCAALMAAGCTGGNSGAAASAGAPTAMAAPSGSAVAPGSAGGSPAGSASTGQQILPDAPTGIPTIQAPPRSVPAPAGISGLLAWDTQGWPGDGAAHPGALEHNHVDGAVTYAVIPPVGGPHSPIWMNAGVYTAPIPNERAVHNLEHGAVWITYRPDLSPADVRALTAFVARQSLIPEPSLGPGLADASNRYIDLSPWSSTALPAPVVISAWGYQLRVDSPADPRLQQFVDQFRNSATYSPERGSPVDGVPVLTGGRAAADGGSVANPDGAVS